MRNDKNFSSIQTILWALDAFDCFGCNMGIDFSRFAAHMSQNFSYVAQTVNATCSALILKYACLHLLSKHFHRICHFRI